MLQKRHVSRFAVHAGAALLFAVVLPAACESAPAPARANPIAPGMPALPAGPTVLHYSTIHVGVADVLARGVGAGAVVRITDGPGAGATRITDQSGTATFVGSFDSATPITI